MAKVMGRLGNQTIYTVVLRSCSIGVGVNVCLHYIFILLFNLIVFNFII